MISLADLQQPEYRMTINTVDAMNDDIIQTIHKNFPLAVQQVKTFAKRFEGSSRTDTARNIWNFLKNHKTYQKDQNHLQLVRLPSRFLRVRKGGDCKSYALTAAALMAANGIPVSFRYAGYVKGKQTPSHVYTVGRDESDNEIIVDGCFTKFNQEKTPVFKKDYKMTVATLSDDLTNAPTLAQRVRALKVSNPTQYSKACAIWNRIKDLRAGNDYRRKGIEAIKQIVDGVSVSGINDRAKRQARREERKASGKTSGVKKVALAPGRAAFLELVSLNVRGIAHRLSKQSKEKVSAFWKKLGGNPDKLLATIAKGAAKKPLLGESKKSKALGVVPPVVAAILAAAGPVLVAVSKILPKGPDGENSDFAEVLQEAAGAGGDTSFDPTSSDIDITDKGTGVDHGFSLSSPLVLGGLAIAAFFLIKSSKK